MLWDSFKVTWTSKHIDTAPSYFIKSGITQSIILSSCFNEGTEKTLTACLYIPKKSPIHIAGIQRYSDTTHSLLQVYSVLTRGHQWKHSSLMSFWVGSWVVYTQLVFVYISISLYIHTHTCVHTHTRTHDWTWANNLIREFKKKRCGIFFTCQCHHFD